MATPSYAPGYPGKVSFQAAGAGAFTDINVQGWDWTEKVDSHDTSSSGSGGVEERIAGLLRGNGAFQATYDLANQHHKDPPKIQAGVKGLIRCYVSSTLFYAIPCMLLEIPVKSAVAGKIDYTCNYGLDSSSGTYARPL